jgi:hypothetical protein
MLPVPRPEKSLIPYAGRCNQRIAETNAMTLSKLPEIVSCLLRYLMINGNARKGLKNRVQKIVFRRQRTGPQFR